MYPLKVRGGFNSYFLFVYLLSDAFTRQTIPHQGRTGIPKINREQLNSTLIPKPTVSEQQEIAAIINAIDEKIDLHRRNQSILDHLFKVLLHKLMSGEIRVADLDLSALRPAEKPEAAE